MTSAFTTPNPQTFQALRRGFQGLRHYFKQGEIAGHEASKKKLQALLQSA